MRHIFAHSTVRSVVRRGGLLLLFLLSYPGIQAQTTVSTWAGTAAPGFVNGPRATAQFQKPFSMCRDAAGNLYLSDSENHCIRKVTKDSVFTLAGTGVAGYKDTLAAYSQFNSPAGVAVDDSGNVYVSDFQNMRIRRISVTGMVTTVAGTGAQGYNDGAAGSATFRYPRGVAVDAAGNVYVGDSWNHRIRKISGGVVSTLAGSGTAFGVGSVGGLADGADSVAQFYTPCGLSTDAAGNVYVADAYNHRIRKVSPSGDVSTLAGNGPTGTTAGGFVDGDFATAMLDTPTECYWHAASSRLFIGDSFNHAVRQLDASGNVSTLAGTGASGYVNGPGDSAQFNFARGVTANAAGDSVWALDYNNHTVRLIEVAPVSALSPLSGEGMTLFPVPASENLQVQLPSVSGCVTWVLSDLTGRILMTSSTCETVFSIPVDDLPAGCYSLTVENKKTVYRKIFFVR